MDFKLTEEQLMLQRTFREFAKKEVKPLSRELDAKPDPKDCISWELVKKASDLGLRTLALPEELGGANADFLTRVIIQEELGAADMGFSDLMRGQGMEFIRLNKEQRDEFLPKYLEDYTFFFAQAHTEPNHGMDLMFRPTDAKTTVETFAEKRGDEYIVNGMKQFTSHGGIAKLYFIRARTDKKDPTKQSDFLVPADTTGLQIGRFHDKLGRRLLLNAELFFEDMLIPSKYLVGEEGEAWKEGEEELLALAGLSIFGGILGLLRCCYEETLNYARNRIQGGKPIIQHATVALKLAKMKVQIEAARTLVWKCAWSWDNQYNYDPKLAVLLKGYINEISVDIVNKAVDIHGGLGTDKSMPIEKYLRDAYTTLHGLGTGEMAYVRGAPTLDGGD